MTATVTQPITVPSYRKHMVEDLIEYKLVQAVSQMEMEQILWEFYINEYFKIVKLNNRIIPTDMVYFSLEISSYMMTLNPDEYGITEERVADLLAANKYSTSALMSTFVLAGTGATIFQSIFKGFGLALNDLPEMEKAIIEYNNIDKTKLM